MTRLWDFDFVIFCVNNERQTDALVILNHSNYILINKAYHRWLFDPIEIKSEIIKFIQ